MRSKNDWRIGRKGIINVIELVAVVLTLFVSFNMFFPGTSYRDLWDDAYSLTKARDLVNVMDRTGRLHEMAFDESAMEDFLQEINPYPDTIFFYTVTDGIKGDIKVACNCTQEIITELETWTRQTMLNERAINISFCRSSMLQGEQCLTKSDALIIWGYKPLETHYDALSGYAVRGSGIIEIMDFRYGGSGPNPVDDDLVQSELFNLRYVTTLSGSLSYDAFPRETKNATDIIYGPYKHFYHVPITIAASASGTVIPGCSYNPALRGDLLVNGDSYGFWICDPSHAWFDTDDNGTADTLVPEMGNVTMGSRNFTLNYVHGPGAIGVSISKTFRFDDFLMQPDYGDFSHIQPADGDTDKVLLKAYSPSGISYPAIILNRMASGNIAWVSNFTEGGYDHEEKEMLISLLLWAANRQNVDSGLMDVRSGYVTSFINVVNRDMFEIYKLNFGVGYPF